MGIPAHVRMAGLVNWNLTDSHVLPSGYEGRNFAIYDASEGFIRDIEDDEALFMKRSIVHLCFEFHNHTRLQLSFNLRPCKVRRKEIS